MAGTGWSRESVLRDYLFDHPEVLFDAPVECKHRELNVEGKFVDLLFEVGGIHHIIEIKRDQVTREAVGQVLEYYGRLRRLKPTQPYKLVLVAASIPEYRRLPLEEFGIRCVEVAFPGISTDVNVTSDSAKIRAAVKGVDKFVPFPVEHVSFQSFLPPCTQEGLILSHKLLVDSLPTVQREFSKFEIKPVRMMNARPADVLCLSNENGDVYYKRPGPWWAYAFGESEHVPKNDKPNISVNGYPWGLDFAINAELRPSQRVLLERVRRAETSFDSLVLQRGGLELQLWMKLEHQPRIYHWIPLERIPAGEWSGSTLIEKELSLRSQYPALRAHWLNEIFVNQKSLSEGQRVNMENKSKDLNLAIRLAGSFRKNDPVWDIPYEEQLQRFNDCYRSLRPLVEFFH